MDIIRRLLVGQPAHEISLELGMSDVYLSILQKDPVFQAKLEEEQTKLHQRFIESRVDAMEILADTAPLAATICQEAVAVGSVGGTFISPSLRLKSAWDILDRTGFDGVRKVAVLDLAELITTAYRQKHDKGNNNNEDGSRTSSSSQTSLEAAQVSEATKRGASAHSEQEADEDGPPTSSPPILLCERND